jgi:hypothetical protein
MFTFYVNKITPFSTFRAGLLFPLRIDRAPGGPVCFAPVPYF